jgi:predicted membrane chloride channel (bestrophin family)
MCCCSAARSAPSRRGRFWLGISEETAVQGGSRVLRSFYSLTKIVNTYSIVVSALAVLSTWICLRYGIKANFPLTLIATAIVFPIVFSIGTAYTRREKALEEFGAMKACGRAMYLASRDWVSEKSDARDAQVKSALFELLTNCRNLYMSPQGQGGEYEKGIYNAFASLSDFVMQMRQAQLAPTECSRLSQYIGRMITAFENTKNIYDYRTPRALRAFSDFFILFLAVLYGPYFAYETASVKLFFVMPILFALILVGLDNIQKDLENPFDGIGEDDVAIDPERFVATLDMGLPFEKSVKAG